MERQIVPTARDYGSLDDEGFSTAEARRRLGDISKQTLNELVRQGRLRVVRAGRRVIVPRSAIVRFLADDGNDAA